MGDLFKYFEAWDIQAVREEARKEVEEARIKAEKEVEEARIEAEKEVEEARLKAEKEVEKEVDKETERGIRKMVKIIKELSGSQDTVLEKLMEEYGLTKENAEEKIALYW